MYTSNPPCDAFAKALACRCSSPCTHRTQIHRPPRPGRQTLTCPPSAEPRRARAAASNLHPLQHGAERRHELREAGVRLAHSVGRRALRVRLARARLVRRRGRGRGRGRGRASTSARARRAASRSSRAPPRTAHSAKGSPRRRARRPRPQTAHPCRRATSSLARATAEGLPRCPPRGGEAPRRAAAASTRATAWVVGDVGLQRGRRRVAAWDT